MVKDVKIYLKKDKQCTTR